VQNGSWPIGIPGGSTKRPIGLERALLCLCGVAAACVGVARAGNVIDAAHDAGTARVLGLVPQPWRALDVVVGALFAIVPTGTRIMRAEIGGAVVVGIAAAALFDVTRRLLSRCAHAPYLAPVIAAIATLAAVLEPAWQREGATVGGSATGASLVLVTLALALHALERPTRARSSAFMVVLALSFGQEPLVGLASLGGVGVLAASVPAARTAAARWSHSDLRAMTTVGILGLAPFVVALARTRASGAPLVAALLYEWAGERGASGGDSLFHLASANLGGVGAAMTGAGLAIGLVAPSGRPITLALTATVVVGCLSMAAGSPAGPTRFGAPVLAVIAAAWAVAAVGLQAAVRLIDRARVPFARWAAAMVVLLEVTLPVEAVDACLAAQRPRTDAWDALVWGRLPTGAVVLVSDRRVYERAQAALASGGLPDQVTIVPAFSGGIPPARALLVDPSRRRLWRDLALDGKPSEASLAALADGSPLFMVYGPGWDRALARHLVPDGLFDRYTPEPRGASDRWRALDDFRPIRDELTVLVAHDPDLAEATGDCLRARLSACVAAGERDVALRAAEDARIIAPANPSVAKMTESLRSSGGSDRVRGH